MEGQLISWQHAIINALLQVWRDFIDIVPNIIAAVIVLILGLFIASLLGRLARRVIDFTKLDSVLDKGVGLSKLQERGINVSAAGIVGWAVKWFFIIVTFIAVAEILKWGQLTNFFEQVALYLPNIIITVLILLAGLILGAGLKELVSKGVRASHFPDSSAGLLGTVAQTAVIVFAVMASLTQLGIAADLVKILFTGFVAMLALAGGLSFGLGGRDHAEAWLDKIKKDIED